MAKKKKDAKKTGSDDASGGMPIKRIALMFFIIILALVFKATAVILCVALLPTLAAFIADRSPKKTKAMTVGPMNLAGCVPFLMELWMEGDRSMNQAMSILTDPMTMITIYGAACVGYIIEWAATVLVSGVLYQRALKRKTMIEKRQKELVGRWGEEVTGSMKLDRAGFPLEPKS